MFNKYTENLPTSWMKYFYVQELLIAALREWTKAYGPLVLLLEDFDRADALSWSLIWLCLEERDISCMMIIAVRPNDGIFAPPSPNQVRIMYAEKLYDKRSIICILKLQKTQYASDMLDAKWYLRSLELACTVDYGQTSYLCFVAASKALPCVIGRI